MSSRPQTLSLPVSSASQERPLKTSLTALQGPLIKLATQLFKDMLGYAGERPNPHRQAMATAVLRGMILLDPFAFDAWRGWIVGSVAAVDAPTLAAGALLVLPGAALAAAAAQKLDAMAMGDEAARALGTSILLARALSLGAVALLSAGAVILAGPLVFVGLIAPQLARGRGEARTGLLTFRAALLGAALVLAADVAGRVVIPGLSIPIGLSAALIGGPLVIWQMTRRLQA